MTMETNRQMREELAGLADMTAMLADTNGGLLGYGHSLVGKRVVVPHTFYMPLAGCRVERGRTGLVLSEVLPTGRSGKHIVTVLLDTVEVDGGYHSASITMPASLVDLVEGELGEEGTADDVVWFND